MRQRVAVIAFAFALASEGRTVAADRGGAPPSSRAVTPSTPSTPSTLSPPSPGAVPVVVPGEPTSPGTDLAAKKPSLLALPRPEGVPTDTVFWLQPDAKRGGYTWKGTGFRARISKEGDLSFDDTHVFFKLTPLFAPRPNPYSVPSLQSKVLNRPAPHHGLSEIVPRPEEILTGYESPYHADPREAARVGREKLDYGSNLPILMVGASYDLTEELMRLGGQDPYRYDKARFAASTRTFRATLAARARNAALRDACNQLRASLAHLAASPPPTPAGFVQAVRNLETDLDAATDEGRALRGYLDSLARDGRGIPPSVSEPLSEDDPRLCGLVPFVAAPPAAPAGAPAPASEGARRR